MATVLPSSAARSRRQHRDREILAATRELFDERGVREAQIEDIAQAVGINRAIIYRHFSSKEELFAMTLVGYLDEIAETMRSAAQNVDDHPVSKLAALAEAFLDYGAAHPAFADCAQSLLRRRGDELLAEVSEPVMIALGKAMNECLNQLVTVLRQGRDAGIFEVDDPYLLANILYNQALGGLNLMRLELSVREAVPGLPEADRISFAAVKEYLTNAAIAMARSSSSPA